MILIVHYSAVLPRILKNGAIILGENLVADGFDEKPFRIVSHFHADHITELSKSIKKSIGIIATPATLEVLNLDYNIPPRKSFSLNYSISTHFEDEVLTLERAEHIFGSCQVLVKGKDGVTIGYTGDFKNPVKGTPVLKSDILIIESTYGSEKFRRTFKADVDDLFYGYVNDALTRGPVTVYSYHGKAQEAMLLLREMGIIAPFITEGKFTKITEIAKKYGYNIEGVFDISSSEGKEAVKSGWYVEFRHYNDFKKRTENGTNFVLSGWEFGSAVRKVDHNSYVVSFSDHADFDDLLYYVDNSPASMIIVDGGRKGHAMELAKAIRSRLGRKAIYMP
jgi:putative mRNA 3-end processing factor